MKEWLIDWLWTLVMLIFFPIWGIVFFVSFGYMIGKDMATESFKKLQEFRTE